jgi:hypothetical protein
MTKTENRAAARAYQKERMQRHRDEAHAAAVAADLISAIDDYVEKLTGDRTTLHAPRHSIG